MRGSKGSKGGKGSKGNAGEGRMVLRSFSLISFIVHFLNLMMIPRRLRWLWLTLGVVFLDRASKAWIESRPEDYFPHPVITNIVYLVSSRNPGMAFSFLAGYSPTMVRILLIAGTLIIIGF